MDRREMDALGVSLTEKLQRMAEEKRRKRIEALKSSIAHYDTVMAEYQKEHPIPSSFEEKAMAYWGALLPELSVSHAATHYGQVSGHFDPAYIHDGAFYALCDAFLNSAEFAAQFDNKAYYPLLFHDVPRPKTVALRLGGAWLSPDYRRISFEEVLCRCSTEERGVVVKYARGSCGGGGVRFFGREDRDGLEKEIVFAPGLDLVIQTVQPQCRELERIHPASLNTVRIMTLLLEDGAKALSSVLRMGVNGSRVDNASSGGIICGITPEGCTKSIAYDKHGKSYSLHPSGSAFAGIEIPGFSRCVELSVALQERFPYCRMISWDWAIGEDRSPVLIEANLSNGELDFHQFCNGPIFGELTPQVVREVADSFFSV